MSNRSQTPEPRRNFLWQTAGGLGAIAAQWLLHRDSTAAQDPKKHHTPGTHFPPKAKRVVQIFCAGGVSHLETFDHKPELIQRHGQSYSQAPEELGFFGQPGLLMKSIYPFRQHGQSGTWISDLLPHLASCADDLCFIHSMVAKSNNHTPATFQMNSGFTLNGFPCMGSWLSYGLGTENENLPTFVVLPDPRGLPAGGSIHWTSGFLPANHQGVPFRTNSPEPVAELQTPASIPLAHRNGEFRLLHTWNQQFAESHPDDTAFQARLRAYELAAQMQSTIPEVTSLADESQITLTRYGFDRPESQGFAKNCLLARRLLENGVRFVQILHGGSFGSPRINWDGHENMKENHDTQALSMDQPVAALIQDLKHRGMLDDTLFIWNTEFGRSPVTQGIGSTGRDHHPHAFTCFLAGAGVRGGFHYGRSDELGYHVAEDKVIIPDLHATILHLLGLDHERLTFYHNGIQRRLTDVHGSPLLKLIS